ncbi:MAG: XisI protein [Symploca sp. SIO1B1]|nr:XisI protein [Symploca sp. SIO1A3]NES00338.1 XisI protein [Symploca sp. SIO1B1]
MEKLDYRELIKRVLEKYINHQGKDESIERQLIFDTERDRYLIVYVGWEEERQIYGCPVHIDIKEGKIWIERDFTEVGLANELVELGVPKTDIVLAFRSPFVRQFTGFATA